MFFLILVGSLLFLLICNGMIDGSDPSSYSGKIIECSWNSEERVWVCMRIRTDKGTPNDFNTYKKVSRYMHFGTIYEVKDAY